MLYRVVKLDICALRALETHCEEPRRFVQKWYLVIVRYARRLCRLPVRRRGIRNRAARGPVRHEFLPTWGPGRHVEVRDIWWRSERALRMRSTFR